MTAEQKDFIRWFEEVTIDDVELVGGKNASLGEMCRGLTGLGIRIPGGFAITAKAYRHFLQANHLEESLRNIFSKLDPHEIGSIAECGQSCREAVLAAVLPSDLERDILAAYGELGEAGEDLPAVAVRSSATAEDLPAASFAGQQETYLNVVGDQAVLDACKRCFSSLFTNRAISYRERFGYDHLRIGLSIGIQRMVRSDLATSGVMFTLDTETGHPNVVLINASYGLGENIVLGTVNPDEYYVCKPTLKTHARPILSRRLGSKEFKLVYATGGTKRTCNIPVLPAERRRFCLTDDEVLKLARWGCVIEEYYSKKYGKPTPMDIEWAKDGLTNELFIVQARPETVHKEIRALELIRYKMKGHGELLLSGRSVGSKVAKGVVRLVRRPTELSRIREGDVLVADKTDPDWEPAMKKSAAIITNRGGRTCHAAIVSRELGVPAVVGTERATDILKDGQLVTVSCAEGETGSVFDGEVEYETQKISLTNRPSIKTNVMINVGDPERAFKLSFLPVSGVGLARIEFIISDFVKVHPLALINYGSLPEGELRQKIDELTEGYADKTRYFVRNLAEGVGTIAGAFYPRPVIVRFSDFKTNEYANLLGGAAFEPAEENPMLGFRGASRYYHPQYAAGFKLECEAMRAVREEMGLTNIKLMIPFCRTVTEANEVLKALERNGLKRGVGGLEVYMMCEIPSNIVLFDEFADLFDGFSIGSNDLAQLTLGVDRDSNLIAQLFDERNAAVTTSIVEVIRKARQRGIPIGICGQAPSDYPEFLELLVRERIDSVSLNSDSVIAAIMDIARIETERMNEEPRGDAIDEHIE